MEKRRLVELTLHKGVVVNVVAREHGVRPANLYRWRAQYRANKLVDATPRSGLKAPAAAFLPVSIGAEATVPARPVFRDDRAVGSSCVRVMFASGASLRIETDRLDVALISAVMSELR
ncbi:MAG: transposase [Candidatus Eremiobacteraeota bacterium]|nr:transposase [Candidatus Eremiobacteraeota bacterium]